MLDFPFCFAPAARFLSEISVCSSRTDRAAGRSAVKRRFYSWLFNNVHEYLDEFQETLM